MKVVVTGIALKTCLGDASQTWKSISEGKSGIKIAQPFAFLPPLPLGLINSNPSLINELTFALISEILQDANLSIPLHDTAVVIGSSRGCQGHWENINTQRIIDNNPHIINYPWLETLPCHPSAIVANFIQTKSSVFAPMNACATGLVAIAQGYELIQLGLCSQVIVGAVETPITPLTIAGFNQMKALAKTGCYPFDKNREGLVLGEGGAMLVLETEKIALNRGAKIYGEIKGLGMSCDAENMTAPAVKADTVINMIQKSLWKFQVNTENIDYIHAHGTATCLNDAREAEIITSLFPNYPFVSSTKGAIGHTIGASGAISTALSLISQQKQQLLPNIGGKNSEFDLNLVSQSHNYKLNNIINFSFGFGGQNTMIIV